MENYEKKIQKILNREVSKPLSFQYAIKNAFSKEKKQRKSMKFFNKILPITCCCIFAISGVTIGTYTIYEKVWKTPTISTETNKNEEIEKIKKPITDEEKAEIFDNETAIKIANKTLNILGYKDIKFNKIDIVRGYDSKKHYVLHSETDISRGIEINLNPLTGDLEYFCDNDIISKNIKCDNISEEEAKDIAIEIYSKLNIINENDGYEVISAKRQNLAFGSNNNDMWQVSFAKKYNNNFDKSTMVTTVFTVENGKTLIHIIKGKNEIKFEDNLISITEQEAINIALEKEKEFSSLEVSEVNANQSIEKMNLFVYFLENNITEGNEKYHIDDISRNVWVVEIKHKKDNKPKDTNIETVKSQYNKKFFIDATTGEIIGGQQSEFFNN